MVHQQPIKYYTFILIEIMLFRLLRRVQLPRVRYLHNTRSTVQHAVHKCASARLMQAMHAVMQHWRPTAAYYNMTHYAAHTPLQCEICRGHNIIWI